MTVLDTTSRTTPKMKDTLVYHHTANPSGKYQVESVIQQHLVKFGQRGAYTYFIEQSGLIVQLHEDDFIGHHAGNWLINVRSIGICLAGDFTKQKPTEAQILSLTLLTGELQHRWGIQDDRIKHHSEIKPTACPGTDLRALVFVRRTKLLEGKALRIRREIDREPQRKYRLKIILARILKALE